MKAMRRMVVVSFLALGASGDTLAQACDSSRAGELEARLKERLEAWAAQSPGPALQWARRLEERREVIERQGHNACTLYRQLLDELDREGVPG